jgi:glycosyltransferase involved in cell wall biosynthesis
MPALSVIITTHNRQRLIARAIASARAASRHELEIVVVDDASRDETAEVCRSLANINYVRTERNQGVAGARNLGILRSSGDYLCFLDDDDVRLPGSLDAQVEALAAETEAAFIYGQAILGLQDGSPTDQFYPARAPQGDVFWELLTHNFVPSGAAVFRRSCLYRVGLLDDAIPGVDDWDFWVRLAEI